MLLTFDNIEVKINNEETQKKIKKFILQTAQKAKAPKLNTEWSEEEKEKLQEDTILGVELEETALALGRTRSAILAKKYALGIGKKKVETIEL